MPTKGAMSTERYDGLTIAFHWITAALVLLAWAMANFIDDFPRGPLRVDARSVHIFLGAGVAIVLALRVAHRLGAGKSLPEPHRGILSLLSGGIHRAFYILIGAQVVLGGTLAYLRGDSLFNLVSLPGSPDKDLRDSIANLHGTIGNVILILAGLHAFAALIHHFLWRDNVLRRMLPGKPTT
jgi:cytochrome b561